MPTLLCSQGMLCKPIAIFQEDNDDDDDNDDDHDDDDDAM